jgi:DtxR family Mn-dependent transcriptional regulator
MPPQTTELTASLEDYLETIYELIRDKKLARVKDIAEARGVQAGSVSPAMKRLSNMGLISYVRREYIDLTPEGMRQARRVYARHQVLTRLFRDILGLSQEEAQKNACAMEHNLTEEAMDRLVRFFEITSSYTGEKNIFDLLNSFAIASDGTHADSRFSAGIKTAKGEKVRRVSDLKPGQSGKVTQVNGRGAIRQRLLDMGILPNVFIELERVAPAGDPLWIKLQGFQLSLRRAEADAVMVVSSG